MSGVTWMYATRIMLYNAHDKLYMRLIGEEVYCNGGTVQYSITRRGNDYLYSYARTISHLDSILYNYKFRVRV